MVKNPSVNAGDKGSIPRSGRFPGEGTGYALQYSCLEKCMDRGAWQATQFMGSQRVRHDWATNTFYPKALGLAELQVITSVPVQFSWLCRLPVFVVNCWIVFMSGEFQDFHSFFLSSEISLGSRVLTTQRIQIFWRYLLWDPTRNQTSPNHPH